MGFTYASLSPTSVEVVKVAVERSALTSRYTLSIGVGDGHVDIKFNTLENLQAVADDIQKAIHPLMLVSEEVTPDETL